MHRGFRFSFMRELYKMSRYRTFTFTIVVLPILSFVLLVSLFSRGVPTQIPIAVLDLDNTSLSRTATEMVSATRFAEVAYSVTSLTEAEHMMKQGIIQAVLVLPRDMERDVMRGTAVNSSLFVNGVNLLMSSLIQKDVIYTMQSFSTGVEIQKLVSKGMSEDVAYQLSLPLSYDKHILFNPYTNYSFYLLPGFMPMMLLMFTILSTIFAIGIELKKGTASMWLSASGGSIVTAVTAKLLPYTIIMMTLAVFMNVLMFKTAGMPLNGSLWLIALATVLFVLAYQAMGIVLITILGNMRLALSIGAGYSVLAFTFSGLTFPAIAMGEIPRVFTHIFPFTPYLNLFVDQAMRGAPIYVSLHYIIILIGFTLLPFLVLWRLKKICLNSKFWGKA